MNRLDSRLTLNGVIEGRMKVVDNFVEALGRVLVAGIIDHEQLDAPFPHGKLCNGGRLITMSINPKVSKYSLLYRNRRKPDLNASSEHSSIAS